MPRRLVWTHEAVGELTALLRRRTEKERVQDCVESHASLVAEDLGMASRVTGPSNFRAYVFSCDDESTKVYIRLILDVEAESEAVVLSCRSIEL